MKKIRLITGFLLLAIATQAQILSPVKWSFSVKKIKPELYEVHMQATVEKGWTTYSQWTPAGGPSATKITFKPNPNVLLGGKAKELGDMHKKYEEVFEVDIHYFENKVDFVQLVKLKKVKPTILVGTVEFMACDKEQCLPVEEIPFKVQLK